MIVDIRCALLLTHKKPFPGSGLLTHFMKWACKLYGFGAILLKLLNIVVRGSFGLHPLPILAILKKIVFRCVFKIKQMTQDSQNEIGYVCISILLFQNYLTVVEMQLKPQM